MSWHPFLRMVLLSTEPGTLQLRLGGVSEGPVLCCATAATGCGLHVCQVFPAIKMTPWTFFK